MPGEIPIPFNPVPPSLFHLESPEELARQVADRILAEVRQPRSPGNSFIMALSGGRISQLLFRSLCDVDPKAASELLQVHYIWADERCVPPDHPESNFASANRLFFVPLGIPASQIHRIKGEIPPTEAAAQASDELLKLRPEGLTGYPAIDLVLLGMGEDGHVASLFPGQPELRPAPSSPYHPVFTSPKPPPSRVTLGYASLQSARLVWVLVSGPGKENALTQSLQGADTPLGKVIQQRAKTDIFTDSAISSSHVFSQTKAK